MHKHHVEAVETVKSMRIQRNRQHNSPSTSNSLIPKAPQTAPDSSNPIRQHLLHAPENYAKIVDIFHGANHRNDAMQEATMIPFAMYEEAQNKIMSLREILAGKQRQVDAYETEVIEFRKTKEKILQTCEIQAKEIQRLTDVVSSLVAEKRQLEDNVENVKSENAVLTNHVAEAIMLLDKEKASKMMLESTIGGLTAELEDERARSLRFEQTAIEARTMVEVYNGRIIAA
eukprot:PhF_6_TR10558/c0_g1_i2/m.16790